MESNDPRHIYWKQTRRLGMLMVGFVALIFFLLPLLGYLKSVSFFGFPLDFYMIAQGLILLFIGAVFWFSLRQEHMDRSHRMSEDL